MSTPNYKFKVAFFSIEAQSPLHPGAGGENFWIIDKLVQRDPTTNLPCIYASSLKGALREYMRDYLDTNYSTLFKIFGNDKSDVDDIDDKSSKEVYKETMELFAVAANKDKKLWNKIQVPAQFRFLQADLISIPTLKDEYVEYVITSEWLKENFKNKIALFNHEIEDNYFNAITKANETFDDKKITKFCELLDDYHLPVIARNHLEDGSSSNLWYEQVLPAKTKLAFAVLYEDNDLFKTFKEAVEAFPVQIGANASIGYGFCSIKQIKTTQK